MKNSTRCETFTHLSQIPFDELLDASLPKMDAGTYDWSTTDRVTAQEKREFMVEHVNRIMTFPDSFCCVVIVDDSPLLAIFGTKTNGTDFVGALSLGRPDANGSRSYIYRTDVRAALYGHLERCGFTRMIGFMPENSSLKEALDIRDNRSEEHYMPWVVSKNKPYIHWDLNEELSKRNTP